MNAKYDLNWFEQAWDEKWDEGRANRRQTWDQRAGDWEAKFRNQGVRRQQNEERIQMVASWLRQRGLLTAEQDVADIGCGPGRFAAEFARSSRSVLGVDISPNMAEYGRRYGQEQGLTNLSFAAVDFQVADMAALGWEKKFDLVFSSLTPAVRGLRGLDNLMAMSRAWCYNCCFVRNENQLHDHILTQVLGLPPRSCVTTHSHWFHELFNLLWLRGYLPRSDFFHQYRELPLPAERSTADDLAQYLIEDEQAVPAASDRILRFLQQEAKADGTVLEVSDCWYGVLLWDVRELNRA